MNLSKLYSLIQHEVVLTGSTILFALSTLALIIGGPVHDVAIAAVPIATAAFAYIGRNKTMSLASVNDLIATIRAQFASLPKPAPVAPVATPEPAPAPVPAPARARKPAAKKPPAKS